MSSLLFLRRTTKKKGGFSILLHSSLKPTLASIEFAFNSVSLEDLGSHLCVDIVRDEPRMWFISDQAANHPPRADLQKYMML